MKIKIYIYKKNRLLDQKYILNYFNKVDTNKKAIYVSQCNMLHDINLQLDGRRDESPQGYEEKESVCSPPKKEEA